MEKYMKRCMFLCLIPLQMLHVKAQEHACFLEIFFIQYLNWGLKYGKFTRQHACFCAFMFKIYRKAQKRTFSCIFSI